MTEAGGLLLLEERTYLVINERKKNPQNNEQTNQPTNQDQTNKNPQKQSKTTFWVFCPFFFFSNPLKIFRRHKSAMYMAMVDT